MHGYRELWLRDLSERSFVGGHVNRLENNRDTRSYIEEICKKNDVCKSENKMSHHSEVWVIYYRMTI